ncbi:MAG TPA: MBL fold metallo-hydrolase [Candidatus Angelobacter sp.]|nr:MBL fold metallo-hydrolase [Candidatus Angelobacter sp.]
MKLTRETSNLNRLTRFGLINCFLVGEDDGHTLVDTGLAGSAPGIVAAIQGLGSSIRRVVVTHAHLDHVGALDEIARRCPGVSVAISQRESRLLRRDFSLDAGESGKKLIGFPGTRTAATILLKDGDCVGSLRTVTCPGHTPGHTAFLDVRDGTLLAGDAFTTQTGVVAAGVFQFYFPFPWLFSWNKELAAESAKRLRDLKPERLAVGHGGTMNSPGKAIDKAVEVAFRQCRQKF